MRTNPDFGTMVELVVIVGIGYALYKTINAAGSAASAGAEWVGENLPTTGDLTCASVTAMAEIPLGMGVWSIPSDYQIPMLATGAQGPTVAQLQAAGWSNSDIMQYITGMLCGQATLADNPA